MDNRQFGAASDLGNAPDISSSYEAGARCLDVPDFAVAQGSSDLCLHDVVGTGRPAAEVSLSRLLYNETCGLEQILRLPDNLLTMLHRTGGMIRNREAGRLHSVPAGRASSNTR